MLILSISIFVLERDKSAIITRLASGNTSSLLRPCNLLTDSSSGEHWSRPVIKFLIMSDWSADYHCKWTSVRDLQPIYFISSTSRCLTLVLLPQFAIINLISRFIFHFLHFSNFNFIIIFLVKQFFLFLFVQICILQISLNTCLELKCEQLHEAVRSSCDSQETFWFARINYSINQTIVCKWLSSSEPKRRRSNKWLTRTGEDARRQ